MTDASGKSRGFGFVSFEEAANAEKVSLKKKNSFDFNIQIWKGFSSSCAVRKMGGGWCF